MFFIPQVSEIVAIVLLAIMEMKTVYFFNEDKGKVIDFYNSIFQLGRCYINDNYREYILL